MVQFHYRFFRPKTSGQRARHEQGHCYDARFKHQDRVKVLSDEQPHATLPIFPTNIAGSLFDLSFFRRDENTRLCNTATALLLLPYLLHQHTRRNHRHVVTRHCLVIAHSLLDATYMRAFRELYCQTSYVTSILNLTSYPVASYCLASRKKKHWQYQTVSVKSEKTLNRGFAV
jgi:hypothetical protein